MIKLQVIGHLGREAVVKDVNSRKVINFTVAHTEKYKDNQGATHEKTTWVDCAYWSDKTAVAAYLKKGTQVFVEGTPEVRTYSKNDGSVGASLTLRIHSIQLLGQSQQQQSGQQPAQSPQQPPAYVPMPTTPDSFDGANAMMADADDLPF